MLTCTVRTRSAGLSRGHSSVALRSEPSACSASAVATCRANVGASVRLKIGSAVTSPQLSAASTGRRATSDRKRVVEGKGGAVRVDLGGRRCIKKKKQENK